MNSALKTLTLKNLYYQSFLEKKNYAKYLKNEKKNHLYKNFKDRLYMKEEFN